MVFGPYWATCLCINAIVLGKHVHRGIVVVHEEV
jgi:hypothetical protein